jgi:hypothetical protein
VDNCPPRARHVDGSSVKLGRKQPDDFQSGCDTSLSGVEIELCGDIALIFDAPSDSVKTWLREEYFSAPVFCFQDDLFALTGFVGVFVFLFRTIQPRCFFPTLQLIE